MHVLQENSGMVTASKLPKGASGCVLGKVGVLGVAVGLSTKRSMICVSEFVMTLCVHMAVSKCWSGSYIWCCTVTAYGDAEHSVRPQLLLRKRENQCE